MAYLTAYKVMVLNPHNPRAIDWDRHAALIEELRQRVDYAEYALDTGGDTNDSCKWYEVIDDMQRFSLQHPDDLFVVRGDGEEAGDMWIAYFWAGNVYQQPVKLVFAPYSEALKAWGKQGEEYVPDAEQPNTSRMTVRRQPALPGPTITSECHQ